MVIFFLYLTNGIFFFELIGIIKTTALIKKKLVFIHHAVSHILSASFGTLGKLGTCLKISLPILVLHFHTLIFTLIFRYCIS